MEKDIVKQIDLIEVSKTMFKHIKTYCLICFITSVFGIIVAFSIPKVYCSQVILAPEMGSNNSLSNGGLSSLASMAGIDLNKMGETDGAFYLQIYPSIISSTTFIQKLEKVSVFPQNSNKSITFKEYLNNERTAWWNYPILTLRKLLQKKDDISKSKATNRIENAYTLTKNEWKVIENIQTKISCDIDKENGLITLSVKTQDPLVCATIADKAQDILQKFITDYRTQKARNDFNYYSKLRKEAFIAYQKSQKEYASFSDSNFDINLPSLQGKRDYLENQMQLKYNAYTQLTERTNMAEAKIQEKTPDFVVLQPSLVPYKADSPKKALIIIIYCILGYLGTTLWIFKTNVINIFKK